MVSSRLDSISASPTISLSNRAAELQRKGMKVYNFGVGEPDFTTPENVIDYAFECAKKGKTHYTPSRGIMELREKIVEEAKAANNIDVTSKNVLVSSAKFAINMGLMCILEAGEEVLLPEPYYSSYPDIVKLAGGKPIPVQTDEEYDFDFDAMSKLVGPNTRAIIISNPTNPTGKVYSEKTLRKLTDFLLENDLHLISDEIYSELIYEGKMFSPASIDEASDRVITIGGFSKSHAMTGWRIGYMLASSDIIDASDKIQQQTVTCAPSISQYAALEALRDKESPKRMKEEFRRRRDMVSKLLSETGKLKFRMPEGTFYFFPSYESDIPSKTFSENLLNEKQVITTPGIAFGGQGERHFRASFAASDEVINEGLSRLNDFIS